MKDYLSVKQKDDPVRNREVELVERKGLGHPDSICDGIAESVSRALCREYRDRTGKILHHNTDEAQLVAGDAAPKFEGGELVEPIYVLLAGRATKTFEGEKIPVERIAVEAARNYIRNNFTELKPRHFEFEPRIKETSSDLKAIFSEETPMSNDTSFGVGHAPLSHAEMTVKETEHDIRQIEEVGSDVKVMGLRQNNGIKITAGVPVLSNKVSDIEGYLGVLDKVEKVIKERSVKNGLEPEIHLNTADNPDEGDIYLTYTGTSAEAGDDGSVGRGNRVSGLITPHRSMSMEASSGKNPVTHVGKIYNLLAKEISKSIHDRTHEFAQVKLLSQIGAPIDEPQIVEVETQASDEEVDSVVSKHLENIEEITEKCVRGEISTF